MVSFELGKEIKKDVFSVLSRAWDSFYKNYAIDIADPSSMQDACHMNFVIDLDHRSVSVVRASERGIRRSEVRFLMGTQNFFFVPRS